MSWRENARFGIFFGDISAQDGGYLSCTFIWVLLLVPKRRTGWEGRKECQSWAHFLARGCGSGMIWTRSRRPMRGLGLSLRFPRVCCLLCAFFCHGVKTLVSALLSPVRRIRWDGNEAVNYTFKSISPIAKHLISGKIHYDCIRVFPVVEKRKSFFRRRVWSTRQNHGMETLSVLLNPLRRIRWSPVVNLVRGK